MEFDAKVDDPSLALAELAYECQLKVNLISINVKNLPKYNYMGVIYYCKANDPFPALNAQPIPESTIIDSDEDVVKKKTKDQIDMLRTPFPEKEYIMFGKISKEWVKDE